MICWTVQFAREDFLRKQIGCGSYEKLEDNYFIYLINGAIWLFIYPINQQYFYHANGYSKFNTKLWQVMLLQGSKISMVR